MADAENDTLLGRAGLKHLKFSDGTADVTDLEHAVENIASCRVADKTGFAAEGVRRSAWLLADGRCDVHAHARLRD